MAIKQHLGGNVLHLQYIQERILPYSSRSFD